MSWLHALTVVAMIVAIAAAVVVAVINGNRND